MSAASGDMARWQAHGEIVASKQPAIFYGVLAVLAAVLELIEASEAATGPLRAKDVLHAARVLGINVFTGKPGTWILLGSIPWLGLTEPKIRAQLLELHRRGEITLVGITRAMMSHARDDLANRGHAPELVDQSALVDGDRTYHAVLVPEHGRERTP